MTDAQALFRIFFQHSLNGARQGGEEPRQVYFDLQGLAHDRDFSGHCLTQGDDSHIGRIAVPDRVRMGEFVDIVAPQNLHPLCDSFFGFRRAEPVWQCDDDCVRHARSPAAPI